MLDDEPATRTLLFMMWFYERFFHRVRFGAWRDLRYCEGVDDVDWISE